MHQYQTNINTWDKIASVYQDFFMEFDLYNDTYDIFCSAIKKQPAVVFEIGCGPGNITRYLLDKRNDLAIDATDVSPNMVALAKQNNPAAAVMVMDARDIHLVTKTYDGVICGFCIPYLLQEDCEKLIATCYRILNEEGVFYCSLIEGPYSRSGYETNSSGDKAYVCYYEESFMLQMLEKNNFSSIQIIRKPYSRKDGSTQTHLIFIAVKR